MDKSTIIGVISGVLAVGIGMVVKGVGVSALVNPAALLIIFVGTAAAVCIAFPMSTLKKTPDLFKIIFKDDQKHDIKDLIEMFTDWADLTRKEGILALEQKVSEIDDPFLLSGVQFVIDGQTPEFIRDVMLEKINAMEDRHEEGAAIFSQAGTYAPTLGVLGAVIGLIAALGNMEDMDVLGAAISAAFVATLLGIFSGYVLWHPFANKLKEKSKKEIQTKEIMIEGILSVAIGESSMVVRDKLGSYLSSKDFKIIMEQDNA